MSGRGAIILAAAAAIVNERVLERPLWRLIQIVVELCLRVRVLKQGLAGRCRMPTERHGRRIPYLVRTIAGRTAASLKERRRRRLRWSGQEVPGQRL